MSIEEESIGEKFEKFLKFAVTNNNLEKRKTRFISKQEIRDEIKRCNISEEQYRKYLGNKGSFNKEQIDMEIERLFRPTERDLEVEKSKKYKDLLKLRFYD